MNEIKGGGSSPQVRTAVEIAVSLALIALIVIWCVQIISPFISLVAWATIIAISLYSTFLKLAGALGGREKLAVTAIVVIGLAVILVPALLFTQSTVDSLQSFHASVEAGDFDVPPPNESVKDWPLVGEKIYAKWSSAAEDFEAFLEANSEQLKEVAAVLLAKGKGIAVGILGLVFSLLISAALLANHASVAAGMRRLFRRLAGDRGDAMRELTVATVKSVTVGVLGIAFIQAVGTGLGMVIVGVPAAGLLALLVLILVIAQLPALIVMLPVIIYVFSVESTVVAVVFAIWSIAVSMSDMVLKPVLLGRGVDAPMLVILLGAIGGMIMQGIIGLFAGAVVLALGYKLFEMWLKMGEDSQGEIAPAGAAEPGADA